MQKAERMSFEKIKTHTEDVTVTLFKNLDIHMYAWTVRHLDISPLKSSSYKNNVPKAAIEYYHSIQYLIE